MLKQGIEVFDLLTSAKVNSTRIVEYISSFGPCKAQVEGSCGPNGSYKTLKVTIAGTDGAISGGKSPTLGFVGQVGDQASSQSKNERIPDYIGTSIVLLTAAKILQMITSGNALRGDVILSAQIGSNTSTSVSSENTTFQKEVPTHTEVSLVMDAVISIGSYRGAKIGYNKSIAISPTVKEGYILEISDDLWALAKKTNDVSPISLPLSQQDIIPCEKGLPQAHTILQPSRATSAPVVGIGIQNEMASRHGLNTSLFERIESTGRFLVTVATAFTNNNCSLYDEHEFTILRTSYGDMSHFQHIGWGHHFTGLGNAPHLLWRHAEHPYEVNE